MRLWHSAAATSAQFDDPNLVSHAGLVPVMRLAQDCGLTELVGEQVTVAGPLGANTPHKIGCVVAGMIAGADSIDDLDLLRHGGMGELFDGVRAPTSAPLVAGTRLRGGTAASARGAASFVAEQIGTARAAGATGLLIARMDSAFYNAATVAACRRGGARFSVTARMDPKIRRAIAAIPDPAWMGIRYPQAIWDDDEQRWISDAEVAAVEYTAFASRRKQAVTAELIVRRVRRLAPEVAAGQTELTPAWRYHAVWECQPHLAPL